MQAAAEVTAAQPLQQDNARLHAGLQRKKAQRAAAVVELHAAAETTVGQQPEALQEDSARLHGSSQREKAALRIQAAWRGHTGRALASDLKCAFILKVQT